MRLMKKFIIGLVIVLIVGFGIYLLTRSLSSKFDLASNSNATTTGATTTDDQIATTTPVRTEQTVIGQSVLGREIIAYHYGQGDKEILFVGGIHGGYEWNTALVAFQLRDYLKQDPSVIPSGVSVTVIPVLNPDGLEKVVGTTTGNFTKADVASSAAAQVAGRFNANQVDLNRNFDCDWQATGTWQNKSVSGGSAAFSEPESQAIKTYLENHKPAAVIVWYSSAGGVFSSSCHNDVSLATKALTAKYATASGYPAHESFDFYATTGDLVNWLAKNNIPAISVLLTNHTDTEWSKNLAGIKAVLESYTQ